MERIKLGRGTDGKRSVLVIAVALAVLLLSVIIVRPLLSSVSTYTPQMEFLDKQKSTVLTLVASSSAASAAITLIPDDIGTPIADQLARLSIGFTLILAVLIAEKYLLTILGGFTSALLVPLICVMWTCCYYLYDTEWLKNTIIKLLLLTIALATLIPASVYVSQKVEETFKASIDETINTALESDVTLNIQDGNQKTLWEKITGAASDAFNSVGRAVETAKNVLGQYVNAIAVMFVTSCVIPFVVLLAYLMVIKYVFKLNFSAQNAARQILSYRRVQLSKGQLLRNQK